MTSNDWLCLRALVYMVWFRALGDSQMCSGLGIFSNRTELERFQGKVNNLTTPG
jgi:hypothetical protein